MFIDKPRFIRCWCAYVPFASKVVNMSFIAPTFRVSTPVWWMRSLSKYLLHLYSPVMQDFGQLPVFKPRAFVRSASHVMLFAWRREERVQYGDLTLSYSRSVWMAGGCVRSK